MNKCMHFLPDEYISSNTQIRLDTHCLLLDGIPRLYIHVLGLHACKCKPWLQWPTSRSRNVTPFALSKVECWPMNSMPAIWAQAHTDLQVVLQQMTSQIDKLAMPGHVIWCKHARQSGHCQSVYMAMAWVRVDVCMWLSYWVLFEARPNDKTAISYACCQWPQSLLHHIEAIPASHQLYVIFEQLTLLCLWEPM